jgi:rhomboid family GlyGly-CTERM serine protease
MALTIFCLAAFANQPLGDWLAYDRTAIQTGELWRLLTGHLTHYSADHFLWDVMMFAVLGVMIERRHRGGFVVSVLASATAISAVLWFGHPEVTAYRGLSGIDSALFTHAAIHVYAEGGRLRRPFVQFVSAGLLVGFIAKIFFEITSGHTLFVDSTDFVSLAAVHAIGGLVGIIPAIAARGSASAALSHAIPQGGSLGMGR